MDNAASLRRQAEFYVRLSRFCVDELFAELLRTMAAGSHERALTAEFAEEVDRECAARHSPIITKH